MCVLPAHSWLSLWDPVAQDFAGRVGWGLGEGCPAALSQELADQWLRENKEVSWQSQPQYGAQLVSVLELWHMSICMPGTEVSINLLPQHR